MGVHRLFHNSDAYKKLKNIEENIKSSFCAVKNEMDNHLDSINQNTDEIQSVYEFLTALEAKIDKLSERMDKMSMYMDHKPEPLACNTALNRREQEVFMVLYTADTKLTASHIGKKIGFTEDMVINYLYSIIEKGVPVEKECSSGTMYLSLNPAFKDLQAKNNMLNIDESVIKEIVDY